MLAAVAVLCLFVGSVATMALVAVAVTIAAGELFICERVTYSPATLVELVAVPTLVVAAYLRGPVGIVGVGAVAFLALGIWFLAGKSGREPVVNLADHVVGDRLGRWVWVNRRDVAFTPAAHPHGHGVTLIGGIILIVVGHERCRRLPRRLTALADTRLLPRSARERRSRDSSAERC